MITGFNTDINYDGVTYHVQTEDKGLKTPLILSLVYRGGTILASKRSPYDDLLVEKFDESVLEDRLNRQHKLICAAIRAGRVADLQKMTKKAASDKHKGTAENKKVKAEFSQTTRPKIDEQLKSTPSKEEFVPTPKPQSELIPEPILKVSPSRAEEEKKKDIFVVPPIESKSKIQVAEFESQTPIHKTPVTEKIEPTPPLFKDEFELEVPKQIIESSQQQPVVNSKLETKPLIVAEKVESIITPPTVKEEPKTTMPQPVVEEKTEAKIPQPVEQAVWDIPIIEDVTIIEDDVLVQEQQFEGEFILPPDAVEIIGDLEQFESLLEDELKVKILGENKFKSGDRKNINILVFRGDDETAVQTASVMVKVIGSDFRPLIYHAKADSNGVATVFLKLPTFRSGRAALLIRAMVDGEETELRRAISPD